MKRLLVIAGLFSVACLSGCATKSDEVMSAPSTAVPGEKTSDSQVDPTMGPSGAGANVHF